MWYLMCSIWLSVTEPSVKCYRWARQMLEARVTIKTLAVFLQQTLLFQGNLCLKVSCLQPYWSASHWYARHLFQGSSRISAHMLHLLAVSPSHSFGVPISWSKECSWCQPVPNHVWPFTRKGYLVLVDLAVLFHSFLFPWETLLEGSTFTANFRIMRSMPNITHCAMNWRFASTCRGYATIYIYTTSLPASALWEQLWE